MPGWYGMAHVKWLTRIEVLDRAVHGFQNATAYRLKVDADDAGEPVTRIRPRALLAPPGWPDFMTRERFVRAGPVALTGRAWSGRAPVTGVEVSTDGGRTLGRRRARPGRPGAPLRLAGVDATPGRRPRAGTSCSCGPPTSTGAQPVEQEWNRQGMANNLVQRVPVTVLD